MRRQHLYLWLIVPVLLLGFWLPLSQVDTDTIWLDEYWSVNDAGGYEPRTVVDIWEKLGQRNPWHVPGFFMLLNGWSHLSGWNPAALRVMPVLVGVIALAWVYRLGKTWATPQAGVWGALILASSSLFVYYSHEMRMYMQIMALSGFTIWTYHKILRAARPGWRLWLGLFLGALGLLYTHYYAAIPLLLIGIYHLFAAPKNRRWWQVVGVMALAGLLFLPWIPVFLNGTRRAVGIQADVADSTFSDAITNIAGRINGATLADFGTSVVTVIDRFSNGLLPLFIVLALLALPVLRRSGGRKIWFYATLATLITLMTLIVMQTGFLERGRYTASAWLFLALIAGIGLDRLARGRELPASLGRVAALALIVVWTGTGIARGLNPLPDSGVNTHMNPFPLHLIPRELRDWIQPDDMVAVFIEDMNMSLTLNRLYGNMVGLYFGDLADQTIVPRISPVEAVQADQQGWLFSNLGDRQRIWVASMPTMLPDQYGQFVEALDDTRAMCPALLTDRANLRIEQFVQSPVCCIDEMRTSAHRLRFGAGIGLADVGADIDADTLSVSALWSIDADVPIHVYSVSWQLLNARGDKVGQADYGLLAERFPCQQVEIPLNDLPAGDYRLMASVYAWETGARLPGVIVDSNETGDLLSVQTVTLE